MRRAPSAVLLSVLVPLGVVVPVVSAPHARPHPVTPEFRAQSLRGVELTGSRTLHASHAASVQARADAVPSARGAAPGRPEVLVTRRHLPSFDLLGVTWTASSTAPGADPADQMVLTVLARTHGHDGWTRWTALETADRPGRAEGKAARPGTEPLWVGDSDGYQVRVDVRHGSLPRGLRVDLVDPGRSDADDEVGAGGALQTAQAAVGRPAIFTRADWGADERLRGTAPRYNATIKTGFVHHTAGANGYSAAEVPRIIRGIYAYHVKGNGWSDIGYNFLVDRFGRLWEGRYGGMDRAVIGAHTGGFNVDSFAVSAIGNYDKAAAPAVMVDSIARLMAWKLSMYYRDPNGTAVLTSLGGGTSKYRAGTKVTFNVISGHRDAGNTSCPGDNLYAQLPTIRALTTSYLGTALLEPAPSRAAATYGSGRTITVGSRVTSDQQWSVEIRDVCRDTVVRTLTGTASPSVPVAAVWDLRDETGAPVRPGAYRVTLSSADATGAARPWVGQVTVNAATPRPPGVAPASLPGRTGFVPVDPIKLYDTRADGNLPLGPGGRIDLHVPGVGKLPETGIGAVALTVAASCATTSTRITAWPAGSRRPASAALNVVDGATASSLLVSALGGDGVVSIDNRHGSTELSVYAVGYYPVSGGSVFRPTRTIRLYDSRRDPAGLVAAGTSRTITVPALSGIPANAMTGALLNVTTLSPTGTGTLTVQSTGSDKAAPTVSFDAKSLVKERAVTALTDGTFTVTAHDAGTQVAVDLVGWWAPADVVPGRLFQPRSTARVLDTRKGTGVRRGKVGPGDVITVKVAGKGKPVPRHARAVVMYLTSRHATRSTFITAWPRGRHRPVFPDLSVGRGRTTSNLVVVRVGTKGRIKITNGRGSTHLVGDVLGYYP